LQHGEHKPSDYAEEQSKHVPEDQINQPCKESDSEACAFSDSRFWQWWWLLFDASSPWTEQVALLRRISIITGS